MDNLNQVLHRIRELTVRVANQTNSHTDMQLIGNEIREMREQLEMIANTAYGSKMVFAGLNVTESPYQNGTWVGNDAPFVVEIGVANTTAINITNADMNNFFTGDPANFSSGALTFPLDSPVNFTLDYLDLAGNPQTLDILVVAPDGAAAFTNRHDFVEEIAKAIALNSGILIPQGIDIKVRIQDDRLIFSANTDRLEAVSDDIPGNAYTDDEPPLSVFRLVDEILDDIRRGDAEAISFKLDLIDAKMQDLLTARSLVGARVNRLELQHSRLESMAIDYTDLLSKNEDTDMSVAIMQLKMQENIYRASLAVGARIIQPSLVDFLR
jgi:flagellar hook-associated protein 3 FlgL